MTTYALSITREQRASTITPLSDICRNWHRVDTFSLHLQSFLASAFDVNTIAWWVCEFTFVYNSDAAMMMIAQCSCNHSQLNIRSTANIQISVLDLTQWKAFRRMSWRQRIRLIPHESARIFGVFVLGAIYAGNESMKTRLPWPRELMTQECALVDNTEPSQTGIPPVFYFFNFFNFIFLWGHITKTINNHTNRSKCR